MCIILVSLRTENRAPELYDKYGLEMSKTNHGWVRHSINQTYEASRRTHISPHKDLGTGVSIFQAEGEERVMGEVRKGVAGLRNHVLAVQVLRNLRKTTVFKLT